MNVRTLCLGILKFADATGYEIHKMASEGRFSHFIEASYGSIYPALTKLTSAGLVTWREEQTPGNPPRKVYSITQAGQKALTDSLMETPRSDVFKSEFLFLHLFSDLLPSGYLNDMHKLRIHELKDELERLDGSADTCGHPGSQFAIGYGIALTRAAIEYLEHGRIPTSEAEATPAMAVK